MKHHSFLLGCALVCASFLAGCSTPRPPSNFQLAKQAVEKKDHAEASRRFLIEARAGVARAERGDPERANNTALLFRDAASQSLLFSDRKGAIAILRECVGKLAPYGEGELCQHRAQQLLTIAGDPAELAEFKVEADKQAAIRNERRPIVQAQLQQRRAAAAAQAERERRAWEAGAAEREREREKEEAETKLAQQQMMSSFAAIAAMQPRRPGQPPPAIAPTYPTASPSMQRSLPIQQPNPNISVGGNSGNSTAGGQSQYQTAAATGCVQVVNKGVGGCTSRRCLRNTCDARISVWSRGGGTKSWGLDDLKPGQMRWYQTNIFDDGSPIEYQACTWHPQASYGPSREPCRY